MAHPTTILNQLQHLLPRNAFESFVGQHGADRYVKHFTCWNQLCVLLYAQAAGKDSLRDIETALRMRDSTWYHLGLTNVARNTLARANGQRSWQLYQSLFYELLQTCQELSRSSQKEFSFRNDLRTIDSSTIDLCLSLFDWATFRKTKGAIKLHTEFNIRSQIPEVVEVTTGNVHDITVGRTFDLSQYPRGTIFVLDLGYYDFAFLRAIKDAGHHFVIRLKKNAQIVRIGDHRNPAGKGVLKDERVALMLPSSQEKYPWDLRCVTYHDEEHKVTYEFLTDEFRLSSGNIALIYRSRWQVELFFKWIKQHLRIKTFLGTSRNAVLTQIWIAMIYFLLLSWIKFQTKFRGSLLELTRMVEAVLLEHVPLVNILNLTERTVSRATARASPAQMVLL